MVPRVVIIGAGVAGSTLGRALARAGIPARIFDSELAGRERLPRGLGLWNNSQVLAPESLEMCGCVSV